MSLTQPKKPYHVHKIEGMPSKFFDSQVMSCYDPVSYMGIAELTDLFERLEINYNICKVSWPSGTALTTGEVIHFANAKDETLFLLHANVEEEIKYADLLEKGFNE